MQKNQIQFIVDEVTANIDRPLNVLMTSTHPMTDTAICNLPNVNFWNLSLPKFPIKWPQDIPLPKNMQLMRDINDLPHKPDIILSQNIIDQYPTFKQLSIFFDVPLIQFEHTMPTDDWLKLKITDKIIKETQADAYVYITDYSKKLWGRNNDENATSIYHMVNTDEYNGWHGGNGRAMILVNAFRTRQWAVGNPAELMLLDDRVDLFGHNPGMNSKPLSRVGVIDTMQKYDVFINTSLKSPLPASLLEAAAIGMPILSTKTCAIPEFFIDGESIIYFDSMQDAKEQLNKILTNADLRIKLSNGAKAVIEKYFNKQRYINDWITLLNKVQQNYHVKS